MQTLRRIGLVMLLGALTGCATGGVSVSKLDRVEMGMTHSEVESAVRGKLHHTEFIDFNRYRRIYFDEDRRPMSAKVVKRRELAVEFEDGRAVAKSYRVWKREGGTFTLQEELGTGPLGVPRNASANSAASFDWSLKGGEELASDVEERVRAWHEIGLRQILGETEFQPGTGMWSMDYGPDQRRWLFIRDGDRLYAHATLWQSWYRPSDHFESDLEGSDPANSTWFLKPIKKKNPLFGRNGYHALDKMTVQLDPTGEGMSIVWDIGQRAGGFGLIGDVLLSAAHDRRVEGSAQLLEWPGEMASTGPTDLH